MLLSPYEDALVAAITHESRSGCNGHVLRKWLSRIEGTNDVTPAALASREAVEGKIVARPVLFAPGALFRGWRGVAPGTGDGPRGVCRLTPQLAAVLAGRRPRLFAPPSFGRRMEQTKTLEERRAARGREVPWNWDTRTQVSRQDRPCGPCGPTDGRIRDH